MGRIHWSSRAVQDYLSILTYLETRWGSKVTQDFVSHVDEILKLIERNPVLFPISERRKEVRRCVLRKQLSLYYRVRKNNIELITFFDNRRNPQNSNL